LIERILCFPSDYLIYEYDCEDIMFGISHSFVFSDGKIRQEISFSNIKSNEYMKLDFSWEVPDWEVPDIV